jgi:hypothetical protein
MNAENSTNIISPNNKLQTENNNILLEIISDNENEKREIDEKISENIDVELKDNVIDEKSPELKIINDDKDLISFSAEYHKRSIENAKINDIENNKNASDAINSLNHDLKIPESSEPNLELMENQFEYIEEKGKNLFVFIF